MSNRGYGNAVPDLDFTNEMSPLSIEPSAVTSERKLAGEIACPERDAIWSG